MISFEWIEVNTVKGIVIVFRESDWGTMRWEMMRM